MTVGAPTDYDDGAMTMDPIENDTPHGAYRSPEAVIEPPEDSEMGYIIAEHPPSDDEGASAVPRSTQAATGYSGLDLMDLDLPETGRPALDLPGIMPRKFLQTVSKHDLFRPVITSVPPPLHRKPDHKPTSSVSALPASPAATATDELATKETVSPASSEPPAEVEEPYVATLRDLWKALPGGEDHHEEWFFCPTTWTWVHIAAHDGQEVGVQQIDISQLDRPDMLEDFKMLKDLAVQSGERGQHLHPFPATPVGESPSTRIDRIQVDDTVNAFPHLTVPGLEVPNSWSARDIPSTVNERTLYFSSLSDLWIDTKAQVIPGQIPVSLVNDFTSEKMANPRVGLEGADCVVEAWSLLST